MSAFSNRIRFSEKPFSWNQGLTRDQSDNRPWVYQILTKIVQFSIIYWTKKLKRMRAFSQRKSQYVQVLIGINMQSLTIIIVIIIAHDHFCCVSEHPQSLKISSQTVSPLAPTHHIDKRMEPWGILRSLLEKELVGDIGKLWISNSPVRLAKHLPYSYKSSSSSWESSLMC